MSATSRKDAGPRVRLHPEGGPFFQVRGGFDAPVRLLATRDTAEMLRDSGALEALQPVSGLPGIVPPIIALPAFARAHGVPQATAIAIDPGLEGVVIPAAVGHGIGSGLRALALPWDAAGIRSKRNAITDALRDAQGTLDGPLDDASLDAACTGGVRWAIERGWGQPADTAACEDNGAMTGADPGLLSAVARARGRAQFGRMGSGAYLAVVETRTPHHPGRIGLAPGQAVLIVGAGSRGLGYQITEDAIEQMARAAVQHRMPMTLRALACVPAHTREGRAYLAAMAAAVNFAAAHRQCIAARALNAIAGVMGSGSPGVARLLTDHTHQSARLQILRHDGMPRRVLVHRKGCIALDDAPERPRILSAGPGKEAWLVTAGPGAHAVFHSACHLTAPGALQAQRDAEIIAAAAAFKPVLSV